MNQFSIYSPISKVYHRRIVYHVHADSKCSKFEVTKYMYVNKNIFLIKKIYMIRQFSQTYLIMRPAWEC